MHTPPQRSRDKTTLHVTPRLAHLVSMRRVPGQLTALILLLAAAAPAAGLLATVRPKWHASQQYVSGGSGRAALADGWRRTTRGWERTDNWVTPSSQHRASSSPPAATRLHPLILVLWQMLVSLGALTAATEPPGRTGKKSRNEQ